MEITPEARWRQHVLERFAALKHSGEVKRLRRSGLRILGRKKCYTGAEWFTSSAKRHSSPGYEEWLRECQEVASSYGVASWALVALCLVSRYDPAKEPFALEAQPPGFRIVTDSKDPLFLQWLSYQAQQLGLFVLHQQGSTETLVLSTSRPQEELPPSRIPPKNSTFVWRLEVPPGYPPEAAEQLNKRCVLLANELLRRLGYKVPQRLRNSPLVARAGRLRIEKDTLRKGEAYDIADEIYGQDRDGLQSQKDRKAVASRRHKVRKHLESRR